MVKVKKKTKSKKQSLDKQAKSKKPARNAKGQLTSGWGKGSKQVKKKVVVKKKKKVLRAANGTLLPGNTANPEGRKPGTTHLDEFKLAMKEVETKKRKTLMQHFCEQAFVSDRILAIWVERVLPALKAIQIQEVPGDGMSEEEKEEVRKEHKRRFEGLYGNNNAHK